jgi:hypothetical protein
MNKIFCRRIFTNLKNNPINNNNTKLFVKQYSNYLAALKNDSKFFELADLSISDKNFSNSIGIDGACKLFSHFGDIVNECLWDIGCGLPLLAVSFSILSINGTVVATDLRK